MLVQFNLSILLFVNDKLIGRFLSVFINLCEFYFEVYIYMCNKSIFFFQPVIPNAAICMICGKDDRVKSSENPDEMITTLMECCICWEINHPECVRKKHENLENEGTINEDLPNSWECPKCCQDGKQGLLKVDSRRCSYRPMRELAISKFLHS